MTDKSAREIVATAMREACGLDFLAMTSEQAADEVLAALEAAGLVVVPVVPTPQMLHAATMEVPTWDDEASGRKWSAMLAASKEQSAAIRAAIPEGK